MEHKVINVTGKRQITIPASFYDKLGFEKAVDCAVEGNALVLRPIRSGADDFSEEILKDLVAQGCTGDELIRRFSEEKRAIKGAMFSMLEEGRQIAAGVIPAATFDDIFGSED